MAPICIMIKQIIESKLTNPAIDVYKRQALKEQVAVPSIQKPNPCGKLRSVDETYKLIIQNDPESSITKTGLRRLIATGVIPSVRVVRNIKLNYDAVMAALSKGSTEPAREQKTGYGGIRKVV